MFSSSLSLRKIFSGIFSQSHELPLSKSNFGFVVPDIFSMKSRVRVGAFLGSGSAFSTKAFAQSVNDISQPLVSSAPFSSGHLPTDLTRIGLLSMGILALNYIVEKKELTRDMVTLTEPQKKSRKRQSLALLIGFGALTGISFFAFSKDSAEIRAEMIEDVIFLVFGLDLEVDARP